MVKTLPSSAGDARDVGSLPGLGRSPGGGHGIPVWYSCLENPKDRGPRQAMVHGVAKSQTGLNVRACAHAHTHTHTHTHISKSSIRKEKKIRGIFRDEVCRVSQSFWKNLVLSQILREGRALRREAGKHAGECQGQGAEPNLSLRLCLALVLNRAQGYIVWDKLGGQDKTD